MTLVLDPDTRTLSAGPPPAEVEAARLGQAILAAVTGRGERVAGVITAQATGDVGYFSFASKLPEADGVFRDTRELLRLWAGPRRVFLVVRRSPAQGVVAAPPPAGVRTLGRYGSRWLYANH